MAYYYFTQTADQKLLKGWESLVPPNVVRELSYIEGLNDAIRMAGILANWHNVWIDVREDITCEHQFTAMPTRVLEEQRQLLQQVVDSYECLDEDDLDDHCT